MRIKFYRFYIHPCFPGLQATPTAPVETIPAATAESTQITPAASLESRRAVSPDLISALHMFDPQNGWMMLPVDVSAGKMDIKFFQTSDGGQTLAVQVQ